MRTVQTQTLLHDHLSHPSDASPSTKTTLLGLSTVSSLSTEKGSHLKK